MLIWIRATSSIVLCWLAWWLLLAGVGLLLARACGRRPRSAMELLAAFWTGWPAAIVFLMVWHFFFPVDWRAAALVGAAGLAGLALGARRLGRRAWRAVRARHAAPRLLLLGGVLLAAAFWVADHSLLDPQNYDSALYHLPAIRWIETYPIVPGLGLLHGRLAFNQTYFLFVALLDAAAWGGRAYHWAAGLLLLPLLARVLLGLAARPRAGAPATSRIFAWLLLVPVWELLNNVLNIPSPSPDLPIFIIGFVLALEVLELIVPAPGVRRDLAWRVLRITALGLAGLTLKLNFMVFGLGYSALALALAARLGRRRGRAATRRLWGAAAGVAALILAPWAARDALLSGWLAYPLELIPFPVPWRVPPAFVTWERALITGLARDPLKLQSWPIHGWDWFGIWLLRIPEFLRYEILVPLGVLAFAPSLALAQRRRGVAARHSAALWLFLAVPCAALLFWFFTAPDPRFAGGAFWLLAAGANAFMIDRLLPARRRLAQGLTLLLVVFTFYFGGLYWPWIAPGPEGGFYPVKRLAMQRFTTLSGLVLYVPPKGDRCYDAPLPCTPYPNPNLRLRKPGDLGGGFLLEHKVPVRPEDLVKR